MRPAKAAPQLPDESKMRIYYTLSGRLLVSGFPLAAVVGFSCGFLDQPSIWAAAGAVLSVVLVVRAFRAGVIVGSEALVCRGLFVTRTVPWARVKAAEISNEVFPVAAAYGTIGLRILLVNGRPIECDYVYGALRT